MILSWYDCALQVAGIDGITAEEGELSQELERSLDG